MDNLTTTTTDYELTHTFSEGLYTRQVTMPAGELIIGHRHKTKTLNIMLQGKLILLDLETMDTTVLTAPMTFESDAGSRKVAYILEEVVWSNIHVTDVTDLDELEELLIDKNVDDLIKYKGDLCLG